MDPQSQRWVMWMGGGVAFLVFAILSWLGSKLYDAKTSEVDRLERDVEDLQDTVTDMRREIQRMRMEIKTRMETDHADVAEKLDQLIEQEIQ